MSFELHKIFSPQLTSVRKLFEVNVLTRKSLDFQLKMRITTVLCRQHIGNMFKRHWRIQGKRKVEETPALASLLANGISPKDPIKYFDEMNKKERVV